MKKKWLAIGITLLFIGVTIAPSINFNTVKANNTKKSQSTSRGNWLYVGGSGPGNYTRIQDAINASSDGDTVFVHSGIYYENIKIQKTISLTGQNKNNTIIDGNETGIVVNVTADYVNITGFIIKDSGEQGICGGIVIEANEVTIANNVITNNSFGILIGFLSESEKFDPKDPFTLNPKRRGGFSHSDNNTIVNNTIVNNRAGLFFPGSYYNFISNNTFLNDGLFILNDTYSNVVVNNTVNGKPLLYLEGQSNKIITEAMGQIILVQCHNITINEQQINNTSFGIELIDTTHCYISQNIIRSNNFIGIFLYQSSENILMNNTVGANSVQGIFIWGNNNMITDNTITFNSEDGLHLYHSINNTMARNNISNNNHDGIHIEVSELYNLISGNNIHQNKNCGMYFSSNRNNILLDNNITFNTNAGISADYCENISIFNNTISHHNFGVQLFESSNSFLSGNTIVSNLNGIQLKWGFNNTVCDNFVKNNEQAIEISVCSNCRISMNVIMENKRDGIVFACGQNNNISLNLILNNSYGLYCTLISNSTIFGNTMTDNNETGVTLWYSDHILVENNIMTKSTSQGNGQGIMIDNGNNISMQRNHIYQNSIGIWLANSSDNNISNNFIRENTWMGIDIFAKSTKNVIMKNLIYNNSHGIFLSSDGNRIINNNLLENKISVSFRNRNNLFDGNYWNRKRILPKPIFGIIDIKGFPTFIKIPWVLFDWHPAQEPYDISGMS